ncbi:MFS transporter [Rhizobiaceae bacterium]|nr:MFS transporter [Rhizobiaceae bacterium]
MFFDWAAQPVFTVVTTFIFGPYVISRMAADAETGQAAWGYGIAAGGLAIALLSPLLGSIADRTGPKKPWIGVFSVVMVLALTSLWFAAPGSSLFWVVGAFTLASIAVEFAGVFNDSMMPRLVPTKDIGRVSNIAWGLGYLGGLIVLIGIIALLAASPETGRTILGLLPPSYIDVAQGDDARAAGPISALWYLIFVLPMFLFTPDAPRGAAVSGAVREGLRDLAATLREVRTRFGIARFLIARMIYQDGVNALIALGGGFAVAIFGWSITEIGIFGIILNLAAVPACLIAGRLDTKMGSKRLILIALIMLLVALLGIISTGPGYTLFGMVPLGTEDGGGLFGSAAEKIYIVWGLLIGAAFGPVQASSRSYMARSVTPDEAGRYFGIYALSGRATSFLAPFLVAVVTQYTGSLRIGMAMIIPFFVVGFLILWGTPYPASDVPERKAVSLPEA